VLDNEPEAFAKRGLVHARPAVVAEAHGEVHSCIV
jgi:hypothetical protein